LKVSAFRIVPIVRSSGAETNKGEALRGLSELPWRPYAFRDLPCLTWEAIGGGKLSATFHDGQTEVKATFDVGADGSVLGGVADRARIVGKTSVTTRWSGAFAEYKTFGGVWIPTRAEATWQLPEGPFTYWRGRVIEFRVLS
ncbi:MAG: DUF6544 family protein, partial [Mycobacteriales bacterium]